MLHQHLDDETIKYNYNELNKGKQANLQLNNYIFLIYYGKLIMELHC